MSDSDRHTNSTGHFTSRISDNSYECCYTVSDIENNVTITITITEEEGNEKEDREGTKEKED